MSQYQIKPSQVLIVAGYTPEEILALSAKTNKSNASAKKNTTKTTDKTKARSTSKIVKKTMSNKALIAKKTDKASNKTKTTSRTNQSTGATATQSTVKIQKPKALLFSPSSVEFTPHRSDYEEFNSAQGLIMVEKACDNFAELQLGLSVHQAMRIQENGVIELSKNDKRNIDIFTAGPPIILDKETNFGHFIDPSEFSDSFIELRRGFFDRFKRRPLTIVSDLFPTMPVCYITDLNYNINEGTEEAEYSITFKEVDNTWG